MSATADTGTVLAVRSSAVVARFERGLPPILNALTTGNPTPGEKECAPAVAPAGALQQQTAADVEPEDELGGQILEDQRKSYEPKLLPPLSSDAT